MENLLGYSDGDFRRFKRLAVRVLIVFCVMYSFVYCGRLNLELAISKIMSETGWSYAQMGILSSTVFWCYGFGHLINGRLSELLGSKHMIFTGVMCSALINIFVSFQTSFLFICILWGINGFCQSMIWSPGLSLLSKWWPGPSRGFANGIAAGASALSSVVVWIVVFLAFYLFPAEGWKAAFRFPPLLMILLGILFYTLAPEKPEVVGLKEYEEPDKVIAEQETNMKRDIAKGGYLYPYFCMLKNSGFCLWLLIIALSTICRYGLLTWIPTYYVEVFNVNIKEGLMGSIGLPIGMACGSFIVPWLTDRYCPNNRNIAAIICAISAGLTVMGFSAAGPGIVAGALLFLAGFSIYAINGIAWVYAIEVGGRASPGTAAGMLDWAAYMGAAVQAIIFGGVLSIHHDWSYVFDMIGIVSISIAVLAILVTYLTKIKLNKLKTSEV